MKTLMIETKLVKPDSFDFKVTARSPAEIKSFYIGYDSRSVISEEKPQGDIMFVLAIEVDPLKDIITKEYVFVPANVQLEIMSGFDLKFCCIAKAGNDIISIYEKISYLSSLCD